MIASPCAAIAKAIACEAPDAARTSIAAPAPAWVAAPAGAIGSAAAAADAQRKASASGIEASRATASSSTKSAAPRTSQERLTSAQAFDASRGHVECSRSQRASRKRESLLARAIVGSRSTTAAAAIPATATPINPARNSPVVETMPAETAASGARAALSISPRSRSERQTPPTPAHEPG